MVLTQRCIRRWACYYISWVSIPLWFSRNSFGPVDGSLVVISFHTTMVLTQPCIRRKAPFAAQGGFHTTMVLTQHTVRVAAYGGNQFPYHYGSHATKEDSQVGCSRNLCFHTTMVLTQRAAQSIRDAQTTTCFHTTMVLTQQKIGMRCSCPTHSVSIPLWFSRNPIQYC